MNKLNSAPIRDPYFLRIPCAPPQPASADLPPLSAQLIESCAEDISHLDHEKPLGGFEVEVVGIFYFARFLQLEISLVALFGGDGFGHLAFDKTAPAAIHRKGVFHVFLRAQAEIDFLLRKSRGRCNENAGQACGQLGHGGIHIAQRSYIAKQAHALAPIRTAITGVPHRIGRLADS